jgi:hypothetical protein
MSNEADAYFDAEGQREAGAPDPDLLDEVEPEPEPEPFDYRGKLCPWFPIPNFRPTVLSKPGEIGMVQEPMECWGPRCMAWRDGDCTRVVGTVAQQEIAVELGARNDSGR